MLTYNIADTVEEGYTYSIGPEEAPTAPTVSKETADFRSNRYALATGGSAQQFHDELIAGSDAEIRRREAYIARSKYNQEVQKLMVQKEEESRTIGKPFSLDDVASFRTMLDPLTIDEKIDPATYIEEAFAKKVVSQALEFRGTHDPYSVQDENPPGLVSYNNLPSEFSDDLHEGLPPSKEEQDAIRVTKDAIRDREILYRVKQDLDDRYSQLGLADKAIGFGKLLIPSYTEIKLNDALPGAETNSYLLGSNFLEQIQYYYGSLPSGQKEVALRGMVNELYEKNPVLAQIALSKFIEYSDSEAFLDDALTIADPLLTIAGSRTVRALASATRGTMRGGRLSRVLADSGREAEAEFLDVHRQLRSKVSDSGSTLSDYDRLLNEVPEIANPNSILADPGSRSMGFANGVRDLLRGVSSEVLRSGVTDPINIARLQPGSPAYAEALVQAQETLYTKYPTIRGRISNIKPVRSVDNALTNTDHIQVTIGDRIGLRLPNLISVKDEAKNLGLRAGYKVVGNDADGYFIQITQTVDETLPSVRGQLVQANNATPAGRLNYLFGNVRTLDEILPDEINAVNKVSTLGSINLSNLGKSIIADAYSKLPKWRGTSRQNMITFLEHERDNERTSRTIGQFERDFNTVIGRLPDDEEIKAYFVQQQVNHAELFINNLSATKLKQRVGLETFDFPVKGVTFKGKPDIEGKAINRIPFDSADNFSVMVINRDGSTSIASKRASTAGATARGLGRNNIEDLINHQGYKAVHLSPEGSRSIAAWATRNGIQGLDDARPTFVVSHQIRSAPLGFLHIPRRPGGHLIYRDDFFISQPVVRTTNLRDGTISHDYYDDLNLWAARTWDEAVDRANRIDQARLLYASGDLQATRAYVNANLPVSYANFVRLFRGRSAIFDVNQPFLARRSGQSLNDQHKLVTRYEIGTFNDVRNSEHNIYKGEALFRYATQRNTQLSTVVNQGSDAAPVWALNDARVLDPYEAVLQGWSNVSSARYVDDLKIKSAERFVTEFGDLLAGNLEDHRNNPIAAIATATFDPAKGKSRAADVARAKNYQRATKELLGFQDKELIDLNHWQQVLDRTLGVRNSRGRVGDVLEFVSTSNPSDFLRYWLGFLPHMGLFSPKQFFLQAQGVVIAGALEGVENAAKGMAGGYLMRGLLLNGRTTVLDGVAERARAIGWEPEHFREAFNALRRTRFYEVGEEFADTSYVVGSSFSRFRQVADKTLFPFKEGERVNRVTAFLASYQNWRTANPLIKMDDVIVANLLQRADNATANMTRASSAGWQRGFLSLPTQFWGYQARLFDLMAGRRLSTAQRARLLAANSLLYGIPTGVAGTTLGLYPWHNKLREELNDAGVDYDDNVLVKIGMDGLGQVALGALSNGEADPAFGETYGPGGLSIIKDLMEGEKSWIELIGGAVGTSLQNTIVATEPLATGIIASIQGNSYNFTKEDFIPVLEQFATFKQGERAWLAYSVGQYFTKDGLSVIDDDFGKFDALYTGLLGVLPQEVIDYYGSSESNKDRIDFQAKMKKEAIRYFRLMVDDTTSPEDKASYQKKAAFYLDRGLFTLEQRNSIFSESFSGLNKSKLQRLDEQIKNGSMPKYREYIEKELKSNAN